MLAAALDDDDTLYWEADVMKPPSPKRKQPQAEEESLDNSVSTVQTAMSVKKSQKLRKRKQQQQTANKKTQICFASDSQTVTSQATSISQLTEMVSAVQ